MTPLAHVVQVAILGGALIGVFVLLGGTAAVDHMKAKARAAAFPIEFPLDALCACSRAGCPECDPADEETNDGDDTGADWDRAHDQWIDGQAGAA